jgi:hypothetical protein
MIEPENAFGTCILRAVLARLRDTIAFAMQAAVQRSRTIAKSVGAWGRRIHRPQIVAKNWGLAPLDPSHPIQKLDFAIVPPALGARARHKPRASLVMPFALLTAHR